MRELKTISPARAAELIESGAVLVDVRGADEYARERIPGARHHPLTRIETDSPRTKSGEVLIYHCRSGGRTKAHAAQLAAAAQQCEAFILEGGIDAWKKSGYPTLLDRRQPIDLMRQVQIAAGGVILFGSALGAFVNQAFFALPAAVGLGLFIAGVTGFCGMARLLSAMPWNRRMSSAAV
jgi:rhodanese-related sulfurtransferase